MKALQEDIIKLDKASPKFRWIFVALFACMMILMTWVSDDAYHAAVMARNLAQGDGFVYNVGMRVNASTCPLYTLIISGLYFVIHDMYLAFLIANVTFATVFFGYLAFKVCDGLLQVIVSAFLLLQSYAVSAFLSSGLENSLLIMLGIILLTTINGLDLKSATAKDLLELSFALSLIVFTRMDAVLLFAPVVAYAYLSAQTIRFVKKVLLGLVGFAPFILWELFSLVYYGYPFPNTYYSKQCSGYPLSDYLIRGLDYYRECVSVDIIIVLIPVILLILAKKRANTKCLMIFTGIIMYYAYILYIGGDFMLGRFFALPICMGLVQLMYAANLTPERKDGLMNLCFVLLCVIILSNVCCKSTWGRIRMQIIENNLDTYTDTGVADEKEFTVPRTGISSYYYSHVYGIDMLVPENSRLINYMKTEFNPSDKGVLFYFISGKSRYFAMYNYPGIAMSDAYALMDPLLSHLPAQKDDNWRIGHIIRNMPMGYFETYAAGKNQIADPGLHEYYDKILTIISGPIWSVERFKTIWEMNTGGYDYLLENYLKYQ